MGALTVALSLLCVSGAFGCFQDTGLLITAPKTMEALRGSCLMIPCNFTTTKEEFISTRTTYGVWIKNDSIWQNANNVIYNSSGTVTTYPMKITGNLRQRNCTTLFSDLITTYTDTYYFRIENRPVKATAVCDPLRINVRDAPGSPRLNISGDLRENVSVTITCSASTPCPHLPPKLTWNLQAEPDNHREGNTDGTFTTKIQETITLSDQHDGLTINCSASYPVTEGIKTAQTQQTLNVSYSPTDTSVLVSPADPLSVGSPVNLTCCCRANPPARVFWLTVSEGRAEQIGADTRVRGFTASDRDRDRLFYCGCANHLGLQLSAGRQLMVKGHVLGPFTAPLICKILGIVVLVSAVVTLHCCSGFFTKPVKSATENDYVESEVPP
ncbi:sialic acid-binding Ig-like lectin 12 [Betta splendens]|uniref:Sialic acid-binding Ig-like lectin 12 n=1 Tax=Betta splendens TaxID=158456 RepID=A0A6P7MBR3_BETSP|nr:sialic acid-binding Ig-like lectin 12 [Betta splendens]